MDGTKTHNTHGVQMTWPLLPRRVFVYYGFRVFRQLSVGHQEYLGSPDLLRPISGQEYPGFNGLASGSNYT